MSFELDKHTLRALMRQKRLEMPLGERAKAAQFAAVHAAEFLFDRADCIALYFPCGAELDPLPLFELLSKEGAVCAFPSIVDEAQPLVFRLYRTGEALMQNAYGIDEPLPDAPIVQPTVLIVPLLAFDAFGQRLGQGGGYYDRTLGSLRAQNPRLRAYGYAYASQQIEAVPTEPFDQKLDGVMTERGVMIF